MQFKKGVRVQGITPELTLGLIVADNVYKAYAGVPYDMVVTSIMDGDHKKTSLHWAGNGADLRIWNVSREDWKPLRDEIKKRLGIHYDVVLEEDHIHLEYQPREK